MEDLGPPAKATLIKTSICPCGFLLLHDDIELGTEYTVYPDTIDPNDGYMLMCGGCGKLRTGRGRIYTKSHFNPSAAPAKLPLEIFVIEMPPASKTICNCPACNNYNSLVPKER